MLCSRVAVLERGAVLEKGAAAAVEEEKEEKEEAGAGAWLAESGPVMPIPFGDSCLRPKTDRHTHVLLEQKAVSDTHVKSNDTGDSPTKHCSTQSQRCLHHKCCKNILL